MTNAWMLILASAATYCFATLWMTADAMLGKHHPDIAQRFWFDIFGVGFFVLAAALAWGATLVSILGVAIASGRRLACLATVPIAAAMVLGVYAWIWLVGKFLKWTGLS